MKNIRNIILLSAIIMPLKTMPMMTKDLLTEHQKKGSIAKHAIEKYNRKRKDNINENNNRDSDVDEKSKIIYFDKGSSDIMDQILNKLNKQTTM